MGPIIGLQRTLHHRIVFAMRVPDEEDDLATHDGRRRKRNAATVAKRARGQSRGRHLAVENFFFMGHLDYIRKPSITSYTPVGGAYECNPNLKD